MTAGGVPGHYPYELAAAAAGRPVRLRVSQFQLWLGRCLIAGALGMLWMGYYAEPRDAKWSLLYLCAGVGLIGLHVLMERRFAHDRRRGFVLAIDPEGVRFRDLPLLPWSDIRGAELRDVSGGCHLMLALEPACFERMRKLESPDLVVPFWCREVDLHGVFLRVGGINRTSEAVDFIEAALRRYREGLHGDVRA